MNPECKCGHVHRAHHLHRWEWIEASGDPDLWQPVSGRCNLCDCKKFSSAPVAEPAEH